MSKQFEVDASWAPFFCEEQKKSYFLTLISNIKKEYQNYDCYPNWADIFQVFSLVPLSNVKVIILGQDPYHQPNQAHGLAFSVQPGVPLPPSLKNIFLELKNDLKIDNGNYGYLRKWAKQGVFLLNTSLTVRKNVANSHSHYEWKTFTDNALQYLNEQKNNLVFILWGNNAISKKLLIDQNKHLVLTSVHPSPLSVHRGFFGSNCFSKTNNWLINHNEKPINWKL